MIVDGQELAKLVLLLVIDPISFVFSRPRPRRWQGEGYDVLHEEVMENLQVCSAASANPLSSFVVAQEKQSEGPIVIT